MTVDLPGDHGLALLPASEIAPFDQRVLLINPASVDQGGEWEAWDFASWYPGAYRYPSFANLVETLARGD